MVVVVGVRSLEEDDDDALGVRSLEVEVDDNDEEVEGNLV